MSGIREGESLGCQNPGAFVLLLPGHLTLPPQPPCKRPPRTDPAANIPNCGITSSLQALVRLNPLWITNLVQFDGTPETASIARVNLYTADDLKLQTKVIPKASLSNDRGDDKEGWYVVLLLPFSPPSYECRLAAVLTLGVGGSGQSRTPSAMRVKTSR